MKNIFLIMAFMTLISCRSNKNEKRLGIHIQAPVYYNEDTIEYYIVNNTDKDIYVLCNMDFFRREIDSSYMNTWFQPKIHISDDVREVSAGRFIIDYKQNIIDSIENIRNIYMENDGIDEYKKYNKMIELYKYKIAKNDSAKFSTKINFEEEFRPYFYSESESYRLLRSKNYFLTISLNENLPYKVSEYLGRKGIYMDKIKSNEVKVTWEKSIYED